MKKRILAISVIVLMLFASCDGQLSSIMEKFGDNIVGEYTVEVTVGTSAPAKSDTAPESPAVLLSAYCLSLFRPYIIPPLMFTVYHAIKKQALSGLLLERVIYRSVLTRFCFTISIRCTINVLLDRLSFSFCRGGAIFQQLFHFLFCQRER